MSFQDELRGIRQSQERAKRDADDRARRSVQRRTELEGAIPVVVSQIAEQWDRRVAPMLEEVARAHWGAESYWVVGPSPVPRSMDAAAISWVAGRATGERQAELFEVALGFTLANLEDPLTVNADALVAPSALHVRGVLTQQVPVTEEALRAALKAVFTYGPEKRDAPDWVKSELRRVPYRRGERDESGFPLFSWSVVGGVLGLLFGAPHVVFLALGTNERGEMLQHFLADRTSRWLLAGFVFLPLGALLTAWATALGSRFTRLPAKAKALVACGAAPGAVAVLAVASLVVGAIAATILAIIAALIVLKLAVGALEGAAQDAEEGLRREGRIHEVEEGVRRARSRS